MKKRVVTRIILSMLICILLVGCMKTSTEDDIPKIIKIIHLNDTHSRVIEEENTGMGYAKVATLVKDMKKKNKNKNILNQ